MQNKATNKNTMKISSAGMKRLGLCILILILLAGLVMGILAAVNAYRNSGKGIRSVKVLESEHFTLTLPMYAYYYRSMESGASLDLVAMALTEQMALYEAALADGDSLSEERTAALDAQIKSMEDAALRLDVSIEEYLALHYGRGIQMSDIRTLLEMTALANQKYEELWDTIAISQGDMANYCKENEDSFLCCDYLMYVFTVPLTEDQTDAEKEQLILQYESYANRLAECESEEAFLNMAVSFEEQFAKEEDDSVSFTESDIESLRKTMVNEGVPYTEYTEGAEIVKELNAWLFDGNRGVGETLVNFYEKTESNIATYGVYYMTRPLYTDNDLTHTVYDIQLSFDRYTEAAAETGVQQAENTYASAPSEETLWALAEQYGGGLYENLKCQSTLAKDLYNWLKEERKAGDTLTYKDEEGWHFVCYKEQGLPACYADAQTILENEAYEERMQAYRDAHAVTLNPESYYELPELRYGWLII